MSTNQQNTKTLSLLSRGLANSVQSFQTIVYDDFAGGPLKVTFLDGGWWVTTPGQKLQPLEDYFEGEDIGFIYLTEAGGKVGALALTKMLGQALTNPEDKVDLVLRNRVRDLMRLGVTLDVEDEPLVLELDVIPNEGKPAREGEYSVRCHLAGNFCEQIFDIDAFDSRKDAEEWAFRYFEFLQDLGIKISII